MTRAEFLQHHRTKYAGLSKQQKEERYQSYLKSVLGQDRVAATDSSGPRNLKHITKVKGTPRSQDSARLIEEKAYLKTLMDPFSGPARYPSYTELPTALAYLKQPITADTDANGRLFFAMRDSIRMATSNSWDSVDGLTAGWLYGTNGWYLNYPANVNPANGSLRTAWFPMEEYLSLQDMFQGYRVVSMAVEVEYTAAMLSATGILIGGLWSTTEGYPDSDTAGLALPPDELRKQRFVETVPAMDGIRIVALPAGPALMKFRQTWYKVRNAYVAASTTSVDEITESWKLRLDMIGGMLGLNANLYFSTSSGGYVASADTNSSIASPWSSLGALLDWDHSPPYSMFSPFFAGEGLPTSTQAVLTGECIWNIEAIVDESTLGVGIGGAFSGQSEHSAGGDGQKVASLARQMPTTTSHSSSAVKKTAGYAKKAASAVRSLSRGKAGRVASSVLDGSTEGISVSDVLDALGEVAGAALAFF